MRTTLITFITLFLNLSCASSYDLCVKEVRNTHINNQMEAIYRLRCNGYYGFSIWLERKNNIQSRAGKGSNKFLYFDATTNKQLLGETKLIFHQKVYLDGELVEDSEIIKNVELGFVGLGVYGYRNGLIPFDEREVRIVVHVKGTEEFFSRHLVKGLGPPSRSGLFNY